MSPRFPDESLLTHNPTPEAPEENRVRIPSPGRRAPGGGGQRCFSTVVKPLAHRGTSHHRRKRVSRCVRTHGLDLDPVCLLLTVQRALISRGMCGPDASVSGRPSWHGYSRPAAHTPVCPAPSAGESLSVQIKPLQRPVVFKRTQLQRGDVKKRRNKCLGSARVVCVHIYEMTSRLQQPSFKGVEQRNVCFAHKLQMCHDVSAELLWVWPLSRVVKGHFHHFYALFHSVILVSHEALLASMLVGAQIFFVYKLVDLQTILFYSLILFIHSFLFLFYFNYLNFI